jgi:Kef-type K+ transport system membrane component KefB
VLGAAVVDDVLGLIILTIVVRIVEQGSVGIGTIATTIGLAVGFLLLTSVIGFATFPKIFAAIAKHSRSTATVSVTAIGVALAFSVLADKAHLAPIIGAFVAGLALRRISSHERVERDVASLGNIFVPVFFLYIGITTDLSAMFDVRVIAIALLLSAVAIISKIAAALGALGTKSDKWVIGFGMLPRGEVGLIFATIGLKVGALSEEMYGSILFVVLLTTLLAPPLLRWRLGRNQS